MRFQSESPFLDEEALEFLRPSIGMTNEAEAAVAPAVWEEALPLEGETRLPGRFRLRAGDQAAEPRRKGPSQSRESPAAAEMDELPEESESSLPGHSRRCVERSSETGEEEAEEQLESGDMEWLEEGEERLRGQLQLHSGDPAAEPRRQTRSTRQEAADWQLEDPTGTLEELQDLDEFSAAAELETPLD